MAKKDDYDKLLDTLKEDRATLRTNKTEGQKGNLNQLAKRVDDLEATVIRLVRSIIQLTNPTKDDKV